MITKTKRKKTTAHALAIGSPGKVSNKNRGAGIVGIICSGGDAPGLNVVISTLIQSLKAGFPVRELDDLRGNLDLPMERLAPMLGISKATLHRRKLSGRLDPPESDRVLRFARLLGKAVKVFESKENARKWLSAPQVGLGGAVPLEYADTEVGAREVEDLLGRIEYGVYS